MSFDCRTSCPRFDIRDLVDAAFAPATGTRDPAGLDAYCSREILLELDDAGLAVVAGDRFEVSPPYDGPGEITSLLGATPASDILSELGASRHRAR